MIKWVLILGGILATLVIVPIVIGMLLPQSHVASSSITLEQSPDTVWAVIRNFDGYPDWWSFVQGMERRDSESGAEIWLQTDQRGQVMPYEVLESVAPERLVTKIADDNLPFGGTWTYLVDPSNGGSRVTITEDGEVYNPFFRFVSRFVMGHHGTMDGYLKALGRHLGEDVNPVHIHFP